MARGLAAGFLTRDWYPQNVPESLRKVVLQGLKKQVKVRNACMVRFECKAD